jgi:hypothetical protein
VDGRRCDGKAKRGGYGANDLGVEAMDGSEVPPRGICAVTRSPDVDAMDDFDPAVKPLWATGKSHVRLE